MPEENQPPRRNHSSYKRDYEAIPEETKRAIKADWLTGKYNSTDLSDKYNVVRNRIVAHIRFQWTKDAKAMGITPAKELPLERRSYGRGTWNKVRLDFMAGKTYAELAIKYNIPAQYIQFMSYKRGWIIEREKFYEESKGMLKNVVQSSADELAMRYNGFMRSAIDQIDVMSEKLKVMAAEGTCTPDRLKSMVDSLGSIINMGMKIYGMEKPQTQVNNQFIRMDVLDSSAASTMNHLAKTIDISIKKSA